MVKDKVLSLLLKQSLILMWETLSFQNQIDADKFDLQDREFKRGYPEKVC
jgi:hypothetical protein